MSVKFNIGSIKNSIVRRPDQEKIIRTLELGKPLLKTAVGEDSFVKISATKCGQQLVLKAKPKGIKRFFTPGLKKTFNILKLNKKASIDDPIRVYKLQLPELAASITDLVERL